MSKIGNAPIQLPSVVNVQLESGRVTVNGPKGSLNYELPNIIGVEIDTDTNTLNFTRKSEEKAVRALHGLWRSLINNAVVGVVTPWTKRLQIVGTGFRVKMEGANLVAEVGYSHPVKFSPAVGVTLAIENNNIVVVSGIDKQKVGEVAKNIKAIRKPDAYKGKGFRYEGEYVKVKPGKKSKA